MLFYNIIGSTKMISPRQIKAARALLGWTQIDLAKASGLHPNAINKIENEAGEPRPVTLSRIQAACEVANIRFRGQRGVEIKEDSFEIMRFDGPDYIRRLTDDIISIVRSADDEVLNCIADEHFFNQADIKQVNRYFGHKKKINFRERYIMSKKASTFRGKEKQAYRWLPEKNLGVVSYFVYRDRVVFIQWPIKQILVIKNQSLSDTFRNQFEYLWNQAKPFA